MSTSLFPHSNAFAFLEALSIDAEKALALQINRALLTNPEPDEIKSLIMIRQQQAVKLDFALLLGRRCLSFGCSRSDEIQFPLASDIDRHHFILHFDIQSEVLLLTDTSTRGIWLSDASIQTPRLLHRTTAPLLQTTDIYFGRDQRYQFRITASSGVNDKTTFARLFEDYAKSIHQMTPSLIERPSLSVGGGDGSSKASYQMVLRTTGDRVSDIEQLESDVMPLWPERACETPPSLWNTLVVRALAFALAFALAIRGLWWGAN